MSKIKLENKVLEGVSLGESSGVTVGELFTIMCDAKPQGGLTIPEMNLRDSIKESCSGKKKTLEFDLPILAYAFQLLINAKFDGFFPSLQELATEIDKLLK